MKTAIILVMCLATAFGHSMVLKRQKRSPCASPCSLTLNGKKYEITEGSNKVIHCNEWQCKRNSNGYCTASVVVAKCEKAEGSCVDVGTAEGCNKECVAGQYGMATWKYTKCKDSAGVCYEPDESKTKHCVTYKCIVTANSYSLTIPKKECLKETVDGVDVCKPEGDTYTKNCKTYKCTVGGPIRYVEDTSVPKQCYYNGSCLAKGDIRSCHKCKSDGTMEWKCKDSAGVCYEPDESKTKHCVTYKCIVTANSYSLTIPKKECLKETVDGVDVCKPEGDTYTKNCKTYKCTVGGPIRYVEDTSVPKQCYYNGSCLAKGDIRSCHKCKSDGTMEWKCKDSSGNCHSIGETWGNCKCVVKGITLSIDCS